jgi:dienelactone hydrolase
LTYENVSFTNRDNLTLQGRYIPTHNRAAVILLHPQASNRVATVDGAPLLAHGCGVWLLDLPAHGESQGDVFPFGGPEIEDVRAAVVYLLTRADIGAEQIGAMGWSLGAQVVILGAARVPGVQTNAVPNPTASVAAQPPARAG